MRYISLAYFLHSTHLTIFVSIKLLQHFSHHAEWPHDIQTILDSSVIHTTHYCLSNYNSHVYELYYLVSQFADSLNKLLQVYLLHKDLDFILIFISPYFSLSTYLHRNRVNCLKTDTN